MLKQKRGDSLKPNWEDEYETPAEIDLSKGTWIKNPFVQDFKELKLVSLDPDVKSTFPDSEAVNGALRELIKAKEFQRAGLAKAS